MPDFLKNMQDEFFILGKPNFDSTKELIGNCGIGDVTVFTKKPLQFNRSNHDISITSTRCLEHTPVLLWLSAY